VYCTHCGEERADGATVCANCGQQVQVFAAPASARARTGCIVAMIAGIVIVAAATALLVLR
jgi:uncharacterized membrane protein YvbJ